MKQMINMISTKQKLPVEQINKKIKIKMENTPLDGIGNIFDFLNFPAPKTNYYGVNMGILLFCELDHCSQLFSYNDHIVYLYYFLL